MVVQKTYYYHLKRCRGLLLAQITDLVNAHTPQHIIGTRVHDCPICREYAKQHQQFIGFDSVIKHRQLSDKRAQLSSHNQRTYSYLCSYHDGSRPCLIIEVNQIEARRCFVKRVPAQQSDITVKRISRQKARQLVEQISTEAVRDYSQFLRRFDRYTGFVLSLSRPLTTIKNELDHNTRDYCAS